MININRNAQIYEKLFGVSISFKSPDTKKFENHCYTISQRMYVCMYVHNLFSHSTAKEQLVFLQYLVIVDKVVMNILIHVQWMTSILLSLQSLGVMWLYIYAF